MQKQIQFKYCIQIALLSFSNHPFSPISGERQLPTHFVYSLLWYLYHICSCASILFFNVCTVLIAVFPDSVFLSPILWLSPLKNRLHWLFVHVRPIYLFLSKHYRSHYLTFYSYAMIRSNMTKGQNRWKWNPVWFLQLCLYSSAFLQMVVNMSPVSAQPYASTQELFTLHSGETVDSSLTSLKSENLYLIVETDGKCENGDLSFTLK